MAEILIYDDIGPDWAGMVSAKWVAEELAKVGDGNPVTVRINSPGGSVVEAQAIYNALGRRTGKTLVAIDGLAASAASYVMLAGDRIEIAENAMVMIHPVWTFAMGNAEALRDTANVLDKFDEIVLDGYVSRSAGKKSRDELRQAMADETWFTASEALEWGLVDEIGQPLQVAACVAPGRFKNTPAPMQDNAAGERMRHRRLAAAKLRLRLAKANA